MSARRLALLRPLLLAAVLTAPQLLGQTADPNVERGIMPGKAYDVGEPDMVNLFNGNLNLKIPIGQTYHVGGDLSYSLALQYGGNAWEHATRTVEEAGTPINCTWTGCSYTYFTRTYGWGFPSRRSNAGQGWILSLGGLWNKFGCPSTGTCIFTAYEAPDGALHSINTSTLHALDPNELPSPTSQNPNVFYSRDGTYLRYKTVANPDGPQIEFPNGITEVYDPHTGQLTQRYDRFGNSLRIFYNDTNNPYCDPQTPHCASTWHLQDSQGRNHYIYFKPGPSYYEFQSPLENSTNPALVPHEIVAGVVLQTFNNTTATYTFHYEGEADGSWSTVSRQNGPDTHLDLGVGCSTKTALLASVVLPDASQSTYSMTYDHGYACTGTQTNAGFNSSNILSLTLPTAGKIAWTYHWYQFNNPGIAADPNMSASGVGTRTISDAAGLPISVTTYDQDINSGAGIPAPESHTTVTVSSGDGATTFSKVTHYFSTCVNTKGGGGCMYPTGEYGLPFSRLQGTDSSGTRYLSTVVYSPDANGNWTTVSRRTYLRYDADAPMTGSRILDKNRRVLSQRTVYEDGTVADDDYSSFDGLGHFRQQTTGGTFGRADVRTLFTNFNPGVGTFALVNGTVSGYSMLSVGSPWVLDTSTFATVTETLPGASSPTTSMVQTCFDTSTGFLKRKRTLKQPQSSANPSSITLDSTDVLAVFTPNSAGDLMREQYLGGDKGPAPSTSDTCNSSVSSEAYRIEHTYSYGSLATSQFYDQYGSALSFKNVDQDIDANTGLVKTSRERADASSSGLITNYKYDVFGRLTDVQPSGSTHGGSWTQYFYTMAPPKVDTYHLPNGAASGALKHTATQFDVLGRVWRELEDMPDGTTSIRETLYNGAGWKSTVSERENDPTHVTTFTYDPFGRPAKVTAPDGSTVTKSYVGSSSVTTTVGVRTAGDATNIVLSDSSTTETFDRQGRLWKVADPAGTVTEYTYDIGDRLSMVCMNKSGSTCGQTRTFTYDNRGFLNNEVHPEKGVSGNGTTNYYDYDARGHVGRRLDGTPSGTFDLSYSYDRAEHLRTVYYTGSGRTLKMFDYGTNNDLGNGDYRNGKLTQAVRFNWFDQFSWNVQVAELYTYAGKDGRISAKTTLDYECQLATSPCTVYPTGTQAKNFTQTFTYDDIGDLVSQGYPDCHQSGCAGVVPAAPTVTNGFTQGFLTSVTWPGLTNSNTISYWPNGLVKRVTHANNVVDDIELDPNAMKRPASISTSGAQDTANCTTPTISSNPESTSITAGSQKTLNVGITSDSNTTSHPVTYQWYNNGTSLTGQTGQSLQVNTVGNYWVQVSNGCGSVSSSAATVTMCQAPAISTQPSGRTITQGMTTSLDVGATGTDLKYQWFWQASAFSIPVGQNSSRLTVTPTFTTSYWVQVSNDCGFAYSYNATVTVRPRPTAPATIVASWGGGGSPVSITWTVPTSVGSGIDHYELQRESDGYAFATISTPAANATLANDFFIGGNTAYVYRIRVVDTNGIASPWSNPDVATTMTFSDDPVVAQSTLIRGVHISELQQAVDALRRTANLPAAWTSYSPPTGAILASNIMDLRDALDVARGVLGLPPVGYTYPSETAGNPVFAADINDLRSGLK